jgi:hypothetical protein
MLDRINGDEYGFFAHHEGTKKVKRPLFLQNLMPKSIWPILPHFVRHNTILQQLFHYGASWGLIAAAGTGERFVDQAIIALYQLLGQL